MEEMTDKEKTAIRETFAILEKMMNDCAPDSSAACCSAESPGDVAAAGPPRSAEQVLEQIKFYMEAVIESEIKKRDEAGPVHEYHEAHGKIEALQNVLYVYESDFAKHAVVREL